MRYLTVLFMLIGLLSTVAVAEPVVVARVDFEDWGGYQARFGDLNNDGSLDIIVARRRRAHSYDQVIGCLTAYDIKSHCVIWQRGNPAICETSNFSDLPFQIYDIDNDGFAEVIAVLDDNEIHILSGQTGKTLRFSHVRGSSMPMPRSYTDSICIANVTGKARAADIILKDRHTGMVALNADLSEIAQFSITTKRQRHIIGHFPLAWDFDHDGTDEIMWGRGIIKLSGDKFKELWRTPIGDHMDSFTVLGENVAVAADCCYVVSSSGDIVWESPRTHAQKVASGRFRTDTNHQQLAVLTLHDPDHNAEDTVCMYDCVGNLLWEHTYGKVKGFRCVSGWCANGHDCLVVSRVKAVDALVVNGDGVEIAKLPAPAHCRPDTNTMYGGDSPTRWRWVEPRQMLHVFDMTGDDADEVAIWNLDGLAIYSKGASHPTPKDYANDRDLYNYSGYTEQPR